MTNEDRLDGTEKKKVFCTIYNFHFSFIKLSFLKDKRNCDFDLKMERLIKMFGSQVQFQI